MLRCPHCGNLAQTQGQEQWHVTQFLFPGSDVGREVNFYISFPLVLFMQVTSVGKSRGKKMPCSLQKAGQRRNCLAQNYNSSSSYPDQGILLE